MMNEENETNTSGLIHSLTNALVGGLQAQGQSPPVQWTVWQQDYQQSLINIEQPRILLLETNPLKFCAAVLTFLAMGRGCLFLGNPTWQNQERQQLIQQVAPNCFWTNIEGWPSRREDAQQNTKPQTSNLPTHQSWIGIPTGGSSHSIRFAMHSVSTLTAAVDGFRQFFASTLSTAGQIHSLCLLPLFHVGGLMQWWRSGLSGGNIVFADYRQLKEAPLNLTEDFDWLLSLVPTQLKALMDHHPQWLQQFRLIFVGGAPAWSELLNRARQLNLNLAPTYGMTETAAQIATLLPTEFLAGQTGVGRILPHASVAVEMEGGNSSGLLTIQSRSLCWGYYPDHPLSQPWQTEDLGYFRQNYLHILGRQQRQIISGGEKIDPLAIEQLFLSANKVQDIVVLGIPDSYWGEQVIAIYQPLTAEITEAQLKHWCRSQLAPHYCPKKWIPVPVIRRSPLGKVDYPALKAWAIEQVLKQSALKK